MTGTVEQRSAGPAEPPARRAQTARQRPTRRGPGPKPRRQWRWRFAWLGFGLAVVAIAAVTTSSPGRYVVDNRFDWYWSPGTPLWRSGFAWDAALGLGRPTPDFEVVVTGFLAVLRTLGVEPALAERLLHASLLTLAGLGAMALLRLFHPRLGLAHAIAAVVYTRTRGSPRRGATRGGLHDRHARPRPRDRAARTRRALALGARQELGRRVTRHVRIGPGPRSYLALGESFDDGWQAPFRGRTLGSVRLDGWRQGFVVPAGPGGAVAITFTSDRWYRAGLLAGLVAALILVGLALTRSSDAGPGAQLGPGPPWPRVVLAGIATLAVLAVAGPVAVAVPVLFFLPGGAESLPMLAGVFLALAGLVALLEPVRSPLQHAGTFSGAAQVLAGLAFAALAVSLLDRENSAT